MRAKLVLLGFGAVTAFAGIAVCQERLTADSRVSVEPRPTRPARPASRYNLRVDSHLVLIPVTVIDAANHLVSGLRKENFRIYEENQAQEIVSFSRDDSPVSIGLVLDCSGSMRDKMDRARQAVAEFLRLANPQDEFFLVQFSNDARLSLRFTRNPHEVEKKLTSTLPNGTTALLDAVYRAVHEMKKAQNPRKALVLISDGGDNHSRYTENEIKKLVRESDVQVYAVGIYGSFVKRLRSPEEMAGPNVLRWIAAETGGRHYAIKEASELPEVAAEIGLQLRNQYLLGYRPCAPAVAGKYRRIQLKVDPPAAGDALRAFWRRGYFAPSE